MNLSMIPVERLPDAALGKDPLFSRTQAMVQLAASERMDREALLARVVEQPGESRRYRAVAAIALGRILTPSAEQILLRNLKDGDTTVLPELLLSLGAIGGRDALTAIDALAWGKPNRASAAAAYAATLIAHRLGLPGNELPFPPARSFLDLPASQTRPIRFTPLDARAGRDVLVSMQRHPYGIAFDERRLTLIECSGEVNVVCVNREFLGAAATELARRKALLALVALRSPESGEYSVSYSVLSRPVSRDGTIEVMVHRCSGALALAGTGSVVDARVEFELRSVTRPGALAIVVKGDLHDGRVTITRALSSTTREKRRVPARRVVTLNSTQR